MHRDSSRELRCDPITAYNHVAAEFARLSGTRRDYLSTVERLIIQNIPPGSRSLLDIGAGDGSRALRIASAAQLKQVVLLEPSVQMRRNWPTTIECWPIRAEDLGQKAGSFDVITCLWNVIGHVFPYRNRIILLQQCARLLSPSGRVFIDVNHRYNGAHYGWGRTLLRMLRDLIAWRETNGDVRVRWQAEGGVYATQGHVFTHAEFTRMVHQAKLTTRQQFTIDYRSGKIHRSRLRGNPLYVLKSASA